MLYQFGSYAGQRDWSVITRFTFWSFFVNWGYKGLSKLTPTIRMTIHNVQEHHVNK